MTGSDVTGEEDTTGLDETTGVEEPEGVTTGVEEEKILTTGVDDVTPFDDTMEVLITGPVTMGFDDPNTGVVTIGIVTNGFDEIRTGVETTGTVTTGTDEWNFLLDLGHSPNVRFRALEETYVDVCDDDDDVSPLVYHEDAVSYVAYSPEEEDWQQQRLQYSK
jgi:hypothetical protein